MSNSKVRESSVTMGPGAWARAFPALWSQAAPSTMWWKEGWDEPNILGPWRPIQLPAGAGLSSEWVQGPLVHPGKDKVMGKSPLYLVSCSTAKSGASLYLASCSTAAAGAQVPPGWKGKVWWGARAQALVCLPSQFPPNVAPPSVPCSSFDGIISLVMPCFPIPSLPRVGAPMTGAWSWQVTLRWSRLIGVGPWRDCGPCSTLPLRATAFWVLEGLAPTLGSLATQLSLATGLSWGPSLSPPPLDLSCHRPSFSPKPESILPPCPGSGSPALSLLLCQPHLSVFWPGPALHSV